MLNSNFGVDQDGIYIWKRKKVRKAREGYEGASKKRC